MILDKQEIAYQILRKKNANPLYDLVVKDGVKFPFSPEITYGSFYHLSYHAPYGSKLSEYFKLVDVLRVFHVQGTPNDFGGFDFTSRDNIYASIAENTNKQVADSFKECVEGFIPSIVNNYQGLVSKIFLSIDYYNNLDISIEFTDYARDIAKNREIAVRTAKANELRKTEYGQNLFNQNEVVSTILRACDLSYSTNGKNGWWASPKTHNTIYLYILYEDDYLSGHKFHKAKEMIKEKFGEYLTGCFNVYSAPDGICFYTELNHVAEDMLNGIKVR